MALQTKTFSAGDFAWKSWSNAYVLDLIITEESADVAANTSLVNYVLQLRAGPNNRFADYISASVTLNGTTVASKTGIGIDAYFNHTYTLLTGSRVIAHDGNGKLTMNVKGSIWGVSDNQWAPPDMSVTGSLVLADIPRVSSPTVSPSIVVPGGELTIRTNRKSDAFTHRLTYTFGQLEGLIAEDVGDSVLWQVPEELAGEIPEETTGWGSITCQTFMNGTDLIGSDTEQFTVTIPRNDATRPTLEVALCPVGDVPEGFEDVYIQGKSGVKALLEAQGWHTHIRTYMMQVQGTGVTGQQELHSGILNQSGQWDVVCAVTDGRGYDRTVTTPITVLPYAPPRVVPGAGLSSILLCRCDTEGNPDINGTHLWVRAGRAWHDLGGRNACRMRWRYRPENGAWSDWQDLLAADAVQNEVQTVLPLTVEIKRTYQVELGVVDDLQEETSTLLAVGTANTPLHLGRGGRNVGIGRYCDYGHVDAVDMGWPIYMNGQAMHGVADPAEAGDVVNKGYLDAALNAFMRRISPDGKVFISMKDTNPAELFGGTWMRIEGRFLLGASEAYPAGSLGGEAAVGLTRRQNGPHDHGYLDYWTVAYDVNSGNKAVAVNGDGTGLGDVANERSQTAEDGTGEPHNNMPPYISVYIWYRLDEEEIEST